MILVFENDLKWFSFGLAAVCLCVRARRSVTSAV